MNIDKLDLRAEIFDFFRSWLIDFLDRLFDLLISLDQPFWLVDSFRIFFNQ